MSCFNCKFYTYTGSYSLACAVNPEIVATSPEEGCRDWEPEVLNALTEALASLNTQFPGWELYEDSLISPIVRTPHEVLSIKDVIDNTIRSKKFCTYFDYRYKTFVCGEFQWYKIDLWD